MKEVHSMKKAQGISLNVIVIAAIALIVLVILSVIFIGRLGTFGKETAACENKGGTCVAGTACGTGQTKLPGSKCETGQVCCVSLTV